MPLYAAIVRREEHPSDTEVEMIWAKSGFDASVKARARVNAQNFSEVDAGIPDKFKWYLSHIRLVTTSIRDTDGSPLE